MRFIKTVNFQRRPRNYLPPATKLILVDNFRLKIKTSLPNKQTKNIYFYISKITQGSTERHPIIVTEEISESSNGPMGWKGRESCTLSGKQLSMCFPCFIPDIWTNVVLQKIVCSSLSSVSVWNG